MNQLSKDLLNTTDHCTTLMAAALCPFVIAASAALDMNAAILSQKRVDFERREAASSVRRHELAIQHKQQEELKRQAEAAKEAERCAKYELALAREEERKMVCTGGDLSTSAAAACPFHHCGCTAPWSSCVCRTSNNVQSTRSTC